MSDLVAELDRLHGEATPGPWTQEPCTGWEFVDRTVMELGDGHRFGVDLASSDAEWAVESHNAWPTISARVKALDKIRQARDRMAENALTSRDITVLLYGFALDVQGILSDLDVTP